MDELLGLLLTLVAIIGPLVVAWLLIVRSVSDTSARHGQRPSPNKTAEDRGRSKVRH
jgi:hypothetical protein